MIPEHVRFRMGIPIDFCIARLVATRKKKAEVGGPHVLLYNESAPRTSIAGPVPA